MDGFKEYFTEASEMDKNISDTLKKIPKAHSAFVKNYAFKWQPGNTLKGDDEHIGIINPIRKTVTIAAPWNFGREFTLLHEIGHKVFENFMTTELKKEWESIIKKTKHKVKQNAEELWCHAYANHFAKNKIEIHNHPTWDKFIEKIVKLSS